VWTAAPAGKRAPGATVRCGSGSKVATGHRRDVAACGNKTKRARGGQRGSPRQREVGGSSDADADADADADGAESGWGMH
jgi:hypothetical protein